MAGILDLFGGGSEGGDGWLNTGFSNALSNPLFVAGLSMMGTRKGQESEALQNAMKLAMVAHTTGQTARNEKAAMEAFGGILGGGTPSGGIPTGGNSASISGANPPLTVPEAMPKGIGAGLPDPAGVTGDFLRANNAPKPVVPVVPAIPVQMAQAPAQTATDASPTNQFAGMPDHLRRALPKLLANPKTHGTAVEFLKPYLNPTLPLDMQLKELDIKSKQRDLEGEGAVPLTPEQRKAGHVPDDVAATVNRKGEWKYGPAANRTNINTSPGPHQKVYETMATRTDEALGAAQALPAFVNAKNAIAGGGVFGAGADTRLGLAKIGALFGADPATIVNTETFRSAVAPIVLATVKATGANPSNADLKFAERAAAGDINLDEGSIKRLIDIGERAAKAKIEYHNSTVDRVYPETDEQNKQVRAMFRVDSNAFMNSVSPAMPAGPKANPPPAAPAAPAPDGGIPGVTIKRIR